MRLIHLINGLGQVAHVTHLLNGLDQTEYKQVRQAKFGHITCLIKAGQDGAESHMTDGVEVACDLEEDASVEGGPVAVFRRGGRHLVFRVVLHEFTHACMREYI